MTTFLLISAALVAAALLRLAPVALSRHKAQSEDTREYNVRIARERLAELEKEHRKGELSDEEFAQARQDLEIALAQDLSASAGHGAAASNASPLTLMLLALLVPAVVVVVYLKIGSPQHLDVAGPGLPTAAPADKLPPIDELAAELERRLQAEPQNPQGWFLLGRTFMKMADYDGAVRAYRRLTELMPGNTTARLSLVDALAMQNGGKVPDEGVELLQQVLQAEPDAVTALWLAGSAAADRGQARQALDYWQRAYPLLGDQPQMQQELRGMIERLAANTGMAAQLPEPAATDTAPGLQVTVALAPELVDQAAPDTTLFVYAKAKQGPPMPLAVARLQVADLPTTVTLNDSMAMMPQMKLSGFERVLVGARISESGQAIPQSGDLQATEQETATDNDETLELLIDHRRP